MNSNPSNNSKKRRKRSDEEVIVNEDDKEGLKEIVTSFLLIEDEEKVEELEYEKNTQVEKSKIEENHKKKGEILMEYHSKTHDIFEGFDGVDKNRRKKSRVCVNSAVSLVTSEIIQKSCELGQVCGSSSNNNNNNNTCKSGTISSRRLWVKDRSKAWWDECIGEEYPDEEFRKWFRMGKKTFEGICEELNSEVAKEDTMLRAAIPVKQRVAVCIYRLATGEPLRLVSKRFGLGISTCHKLVLEVCQAIRKVLMPRYVHWPNGDEGEGENGFRGIEEEFERVSGIPNVVGSMYTTHIPIIAPKISVAAYFNKRHTERHQKTSYSITVQGVVNPTGVFTDICIGWPGSMPDDKVLEKSALYQRGHQGLLKGVWVVGGSSYPLMDWLLVPYSQPNLTWTQHAFNEKIAVLHKVAKDAFARLKGRWCCLQKRTEVKLQELPMVLGACCVLHNICELRGEVLDPEAVFDIFDDEMTPEIPLQTITAMKARDGIAHNLLHHGLAGTGFL